MRLKWKCLSGLAPLKPVIGLRPVWGWPVALTCHSSCLTRSHKTMHVKTGESCFTLQRFSRRGAIPHWLLRLAVMTGNSSMSSLLEVAVTNHGTSVRLTTSAQFALQGHSWGPRGDLVGTPHSFAAIWSNLIPLTYTLYIYPKRLIHTYLVMNPI